MSIQVIQDNRERENVLGKSLLGALQGFTQGRAQRRERELARGRGEPQTLAELKALAELEKLQTETAGLRQPGQIPANPYTGKPAGFLYGGKFYQYQQPQNSLDALLGGMNDEENNGSSGVQTYGGLPQSTQIQMPSQTGGQTGQLSPQEHYNQLRASGYSPDEARRMAGV